MVAKIESKFNSPAGVVVVVTVTGVDRVDTSNVVEWDEEPSDPEEETDVPDTLTEMGGEAIWNLLQGSLSDEMKYRSDLT